MLPLQSDLLLLLLFYYDTDGITLGCWALVRIDMFTSPRRNSHNSNRCTLFPKNLVEAGKWLSKRRCSAARCNDPSPVSLTGHMMDGEK